MHMNIESLAPNDNCFQEVAENVWLMDNHKWAIYVWERHRKSSGIARFSLLHVDYHWDAIDDFSGRPEAEAQLLAADLPKLKAMVRDEDGIQYDSFIAPAVRRGMFDEIHFYCKQDDGVDVGIDEHLCAQVGTKQFVHSEMEHLLTLRFNSPLILDICLDLFNDSDYFGEGEIWSDDEGISPSWR